MKYNLYKYIIFTLVFISNISWGQIDKYRIIKAFDSIEYYSDSTIKVAYNLKKGNPHGYAIEFLENGNVLCIGKYKRGKKDGHWRFNGGFFERYKSGEFDFGGIPGCGTGKRKSQSDFQKLYYEIIKYYE